MINRNSAKIQGFNPIIKAIILPLLVAGCCLNTGCAQQPVPPKPEAEPVVVEEPPQAGIDPVVLHQLLDQAEIAIADDHLTYPAEGSAFELYTKILVQQPDQEDAQRGLERIVELFIAKSEHALARNRFASARSMLSRARLILPDHPSIKPTDELIRLMSEADRKTLTLNQTDLGAKSDELVQQLAEFTSATNDDCRFIISAKNDAQGRWIYQQLAQSQSARRLRAQIQIRLPASVERLCFPS